MPDENRFAGIGEALEGDQPDDGEPDESDGDAAGRTDADLDDASSSGATTESTAETPSDGPAFEFSETTQRPLYAREEAWNAIEDTLDFEVERELRREGIRDTETRELHDAVLRVAAKHPDAIVAAVLEARGIDVDE